MLNEDWENICLRYFEGQSDTALKAEMFAALVNEPQHKEDFIKQITKIALSATIIPLSIFNFHSVFPSEIFKAYIFGNIS